MTRNGRSREIAEQRAGVVGDAERPRRLSS